jgi:Tfp pilus assembly protein PilV
MSYSHQCRRRGDRGAMLLEITCALFILTAGLFGVLQMYSNALSHTHYMIEDDLAASILENEIETLHALGFQALSVGRHPLQSEATGLERLHDSEAYTEVAPAAGAERYARTVSLTVRWQAYTGRMVEKQLATIIADKGNNAVSLEVASNGKP